MKLLLGVVLITLMVGCTPHSPSTVTPPAVNEIPIIIDIDDSIKAIVDIPFNKTLEANVPVKWEAILLPSGLSLKGDVISGKPTELGQVKIVRIIARTKTQTVTKIVKFTIIDDVWCNLPEVTVSNFQPGDTAEYTIEVHNGESVETEMIIVTTDETDVPDSLGFISVPFTLEQTLFDTNSVKVSSDTAKSLRVSSFVPSTNTITISGFPPLETTIVTIQYAAEVLFSVRVSDELVTPLNNMVTITPNHFSLKPHETKQVLISLEMPQNYEPLSKLYEFYILVNKASTVKVGGNVSANLAYKAIWHVNIK